MVGVEEVPRPEPGDDQLLIRVVASSVNRTDCGIRAAAPPVVRLLYGFRGPRHPILGCEYAGVVEEVGSAVQGYAVGDRVFGFDDSRMGGHAQYVVKPAKGMLAHVPPELTLAEAGVATEGAHYAATTLRATDVGPGSQVLVYGASGAIGSAAVQLAAHLGAEVTAVCGSATVDRVSALGPVQVIDYQQEDFTTIDARFDLVFDSVGKTTFRACRPLLRPTGFFVATEFGPRFQNPLLILPTRVLPGPRVKFPIPARSHEAMRFIVDALVAGSYRPMIDRRYPLDEVSEAYRYVETGEKVGNVGV
ncbi:MAG: NAD(P)-dependent alcohol dehydrogenase, partial [Actinomycetota bacterium]